VCPKGKAKNRIKHSLRLAVSSLSCFFHADYPVIRSVWLGKKRSDIKRSSIKGHSIRERV